MNRHTCKSETISRSLLKSSQELMHSCRIMLYPLSVDSSRFYLMQNKTLSISANIEGIIPQTRLIPPHQHNRCERGGQCADFNTYMVESQNKLNHTRAVWRLTVDSVFCTKAKDAEKWNKVMQRCFQNWGLGPPVVPSDESKWVTRWFARLDKGKQKNGQKQDQFVRFTANENGETKSFTVLVIVSNTYDPKARDELCAQTKWSCSSLGS